MGLQVIKDEYGNNTGMFVPITDWDTITQKYQDLKDLVNIEPVAKKNSHNWLAPYPNKPVKPCLKMWKKAAMNGKKDRTSNCKAFTCICSIPTLLSVI